MKSELKAWSSVVKNSCSKAPASKKMKAVLKRASEEEDHSLDLVIYNYLLEKSEEIFSCFRMGRTVSGGGSGPAVKPIKFILSGSHHVPASVEQSKKTKRT